ncbi:uncharacterized protein Gasu_31350 [Galdieria sulphuraria]|uniref:Uncharacterized protein n=1 Tax=Galdieria sulphuraria TaxID=130081 RepID=M2WZI5_GALSU|nr:uncharacterized protein Gasu_31350 [Galdieria sulphuraria]EME29495.1 hypothetical protein Gasu_31350 [Galdieria sulphuraria]|eukprot:XP_005706015.1 hypothetical protein Gasu_31350 [Galdieria sulphuraria]
MNSDEYVEYLDTQITKVLREIEVNLINIYRVSIELQTCVKKPLPHLKELHEIVSPWCAYLRELVSTKETTRVPTVQGAFNNENALSEAEQNTLQEISNLLAHTTEQLSLAENSTKTLREEFQRTQNTVDTKTSPRNCQEKAEIQEQLFQVDSPTTMWKELLDKYSEESHSTSEHWYGEDNIQ